MGCGGGGTRKTKEDVEKQMNHFVPTLLFPPDLFASAFAEEPVEVGKVNEHAFPG